jgi:ribonuclease Y
VWQHAVEVGFLCGMMAAELGLNVKQARRAGLLHDIGKAVDHESDGSHAQVGAALARKHGESPRIVHAIAASHEEEKPETVLAHLVIAADQLSNQRPGARKEMYEAYIKRMTDMEKLCTSFGGVDRAYAIQAGREVRVLVENAAVTDEQAVLLSRDIAKKIEQELSYAGQIKVSVIRETRLVEYAK